MNVEQLAALEEDWLNKQRSLTGDRDALYGQAGVYAAWHDIVSRYVDLANKGDLEALKRALYFAWAERSMGHLITGIKDLDKDTIRKALGIADKLARDGRLDEELQWMLPYYYIVAPLFLDQFKDLDALRQASLENPFLYRRRCLDASFDHRGQMGEYWRTEQACLRRWS